MSISILIHICVFNLLGHLSLVFVAFNLQCSLFVLIKSAKKKEKKKGCLRILVVIIFVNETNTAWSQLNIPSIFVSITHTGRGGRFARLSEWHAPINKPCGHPHPFKLTVCMSALSHLSTLSFTYTDHCYSTIISWQRYITLSLNTRPPGF